MPEDHLPKPPTENPPVRTPGEVFIFWCPKCGSMFMHDLGTQHISQTGQGKCHNPLIQLQFYR